MLKNTTNPRFQCSDHSKTRVLLFANRPQLHVSGYLDKAFKYQAFSHRSSSLFAPLSSFMTSSNDFYKIKKSTPLLSLPSTLSPETAPSETNGRRITVLLTREASKNVKMKNELHKRGFQTVELPLIKHVDGPDLPQLRSILDGFSRHPRFKSESSMNSDPNLSFCWLLLTSPEAASVFLKAWIASGKPKLPFIAVVGGGTGDILREEGLTPSFVASKALGVTLGGELPFPSLPLVSCPSPSASLSSPSSSSPSSSSPPPRPKVLYPTSKRAKGVLESELAKSGFSVVRLNTYDTIPVVRSGSLSSLSPDRDLDLDRIQIVTLASPSTAQAWIQRVGKEEARKKLTVCIGVTTAKACIDGGLEKERVFHPSAPGVVAWADCLEEAVKAEGERI